MYITSKNGMGSINGVPLKKGRNKYPAIDSKDPLTAIQLKALLDIGVITIEDTLPDEAVKEAEEALDQGRMKINAKKTFTDKILKLKGGPKKVKVKSVEYLGSEIIRKKPDAGKPAKAAKKPGKNDSGN